MMAHSLELGLSNLTISNSTGNGTTLTEFHLFTKLPLELQQNIWDFHFPGPQNVIIDTFFVNTQCTDPPNDVEEPFDNLSTGLENTAIQSLSESTADGQKATTVTRVQFCSSTVVAQPSTLLHVCRTSREYVLSIYTACIEPPGFDHKIRLRPKKDTLVLREYDGIPSRRYLEMGETGTFSNISVVALHVPLKEGSMGDARSQGIEGILEIFPKLEKLLVFPISEDLASLKILTIQGHKCFIRPIIEGDHIRSNEARGTLGYYNPTIDVVRRDRESMQSAVHKV